MDDLSIELENFVSAAIGVRGRGSAPRVDLTVDPKVDRDTVRLLDATPVNLEQRAP